LTFTHLDDETLDDNGKNTTKKNGTVGKNKKAKIISLPEFKDSEHLIEDEVELELTTQDDMFSSRNAYMLIYCRRRDQAKIDEAPINVPPLITKKVDQLNNGFLNSVKEFQEQYDALKDSFRTVQDQRLQVIELWKSSANRFGFVSTDWLKRFFGEPIDFLDQEIERTTVDTSGGSNLVHPLDICYMHHLLCPHGRIPSNHSKNIVRLPRETIEYLSSIGVSFSPSFVTNEADALCPDCAERNIRRREWAEQHLEHTSTIQALLQSFGTTATGPLGLPHAEGSPKKGKKRSNKSAKPKQTFGGIECVWISKAWWKEWMKKTPSFFHNEVETGVRIWPWNSHYVADITCEHGNLQTDPTVRRLIPRAIWDQIVNWAQENDILSNKTEEKSYPDKLVFREKSKACSKCLRKEESTREANEEIVNKARYERSQLRSLAIGSKLTFGGMIDNFLSKENNAYRRKKDQTKLTMYLVSTSFVTEWAAWIESPEVLERPTMVNNSDLFCQ
jgi:hypothetical protein